MFSKERQVIPEAISSCRQGYVVHLQRQCYAVRDCVVTSSGSRDEVVALVPGKGSDALYESLQNHVSSMFSVRQSLVELILH